jgi:acyl-CoA reductase-like NAD-dependent aldehyde dehydrogenase
MTNVKPYTLSIDGQSVATDETFEIRNPATGEVIGLCPVATKAHLDQAVAAAKRAFATWSTTPDAERQKACHAVAEAIAANAEELARLLTLEQGKPLNGLGSRFEVGGAQAWAHYTADLSIPVEVLQDDEKGRVELHRKPLGVVGSIVPWNFPLMIAIWHLVPALRTGNTVVLKPSPYTPLTTLRLGEILNGVLPAGVLNIVAGHDDLGPMMTGHPDIAKIVFTGSSATGRRVMENAAATLKRVTLELGGNDAGIILPDADPAAIAEGLFWGAFINNGQTCAALKRLYVPDSLYEAVCEALVAFAAGVTTGDGLDEKTLLGPLQNRMQFDKVRRLVDDAKTRGARILCGGDATEGPGYFYPITLVADVSDGMPIVDEEQFGPVLPIIRYSDVDDAVARANASENGLGGSVWSPDLARAKAIAARMECGSVWLNNHGMVRPDAPFGGVKSSGIGVEFGLQGLEEYTSIQVVHQ